MLARAGPRFCEAQGGGGYMRGPLLPSVPSPSLSSPLSLPSLTFPYPFPTLSFSLPLEIGPLGAARRFGEHCELPNGV